MPNRAVLKVIENRDLLTVTPDMNVRAVASQMKQCKVAALLVVDQRDGKLIGICTERDLTFKVLAEGLDINSTLVGSSAEQIALVEKFFENFQPRQRVVQFEQLLLGQVLDGQDFGDPVADPFGVVVAMRLGNAFACRGRRRRGSAGGAGVRVQGAAASGRFRRVARRWLQAGCRAGLACR
jgi:CBS domain-containing protein